GRAREHELQTAARPAHPRRRLGRAIAGPVLELVGESTGVEEVGAVELDLILRTLDLLEQEAVVPLEVTVANGEGAAPLGSELEAAVDLGVHPRDVEAGAEDLGVLDLPGGRAGAEVA